MKVYRLQEGKITEEKADNITHTYITKGTKRIPSVSQEYYYFKTKKEAEEYLNGGVSKTLGWKLKALRFSEQAAYLKTKEYEEKKKQGDRFVRGSLTHMSRETGLNPSVIKSIETGRNGVKYDTLQRYLEYFGVNLDESFVEMVMSEALKQIN